MDNEDNGSKNRMDLRDLVHEHDDDELSLTIDRTSKQEDENNNNDDKIDENLIQLSCFLSDEQLDNDNLNQSSNEFHRLQSSPNNDEQTSMNSQLDREHLQTTSTTNLSNDNDEKISKR